MEKLGGVLSISTKKEFKDVWMKLTNNEEIRLKMGKTNFDFIRRSIGSSDKIISYLNKYLI